MAKRLCDVVVNQNTLVGRRRREEDCPPYQFFKRSHKVIVALTVQGILDEHIAKKLA
jgi:hypothetical protein